MNDIYQERADLTELCGCSTWEEVVEWFQGMSVREITAEAKRAWPHEKGNANFAQRVYDALPR